MRTRLLVPLAVAALAAAAVLLPLRLVAQTPFGTRSFDPATTSIDAAIKAAADAAKTAQAARASWTPPRTPWGDPDLRGYWLSLSYTPLERPAALGEKTLWEIRAAGGRATRS